MDIENYTTNCIDSREKVHGLQLSFCILHILPVILCFQNNIVLILKTHYNRKSEGPILI